MLFRAMKKDKLSKGCCEENKLGKMCLDNER